MGDVKVAGSFFPDEDAVISVSEDTILNSSKLYLSIGEMMIVLSEEQARKLRFEISAVLMGVEWERENNA
jgi:hypothetical protein